LREAREAAEAMSDLKERSRLAASDLKRGVADSVAHLKQPAKARVMAGPNGVPAGASGWDGSDGG